MSNDSRSFRNKQPSSPRRRIIFKSAPWQRNSDLKCPCGSGKSYSRCCERVLASGEYSYSNLQEEARKADQQGDRDGVIRSLRAHLTSYLEAVHRDTVPARGSDWYREFVNIDVGAIKALVDTLITTLANMGREAETVRVVDAVDENCGLPEFEDAAKFLRAACLLVYLDDAPAALKLLRAIPDIEKSDDPELLGVYLHAIGNDASALKKLDLVRRIIEHSTDLSEKLHYSNFEIVLLSMLDDEGSAKTRAKAAYDLVRESKLTDERLNDEPALAWHAGDTYRLSARLLEKPELLAEAIRMFEISRQKAKKFYKARHDLAIGELLIASGSTADGLKRYEQAAAVDPQSPLVNIGHAMALLHADQAKLAGEAIGRVREPKASDSWDIEYWHARGLVAGRLGDSTAAQLAIAELSKLDHGLYFNSQRDHIVAAIREASPTAKPASRAKGNAAANALRQFNQYAHLKPSYYGVGLNLNAVIDKLADLLDGGQHKK